MATYFPPRREENPYLPFGDQRNSPFYGKDILSVKQFVRSDLDYIFGVAHEMSEMVERVGSFDLLKGKILANLFYEPSNSYLLVFHFSDGAFGWQRHPDQRSALLVCVERRILAGYRTNPRVLCRCDRTAPPGSGRFGAGSQICP